MPGGPNTEYNSPSEAVLPPTSGTSSMPISLNQRMWVWRDIGGSSVGHQDRDRRLCQHLARRAAEEGLAQAAVGVGAHHDQRDFAHARNGEQGSTGGTA